MMNRKECRITVDIRDKYIAVNYWDSSRTTAAEQLSALDPLTLKTIERLHRWAARGSSFCKDEDLKVLGLHLYNLIFYPDFRDKFDKLLECSKLQDDCNLRLRLTLIFKESAKVLSLFPWEFIFIPERPGSMEGKFLAKYTELILTRFVDGTKILDNLAPKVSPIRILVVSSHPTLSDGKPLPKIDENSFIEELKRKESDRIKVFHLKDPNLDTLRDFINGETVTTKDQGEVKGFAPQIFHFIGHGDAGKIALVKTKAEIVQEMERAGRIGSSEIENQDDAQWAGEEDITGLFNGVPKPKFVFLNACNVAKRDIIGFNEFSGNIPMDLIKDGIPVVLAMQYEIEVKDAFGFAKKIYSDIIKGKEIEQAVKNGIKMLGDKSSWGEPRFGIPVFYLGADDTTLCDEDYEPRPPAAAKPKPSLIECPFCGNFFPRPSPGKLLLCQHCGETYVFCKYNSSAENPCPGVLKPDDLVCATCGKYQSKEKTAKSSKNAVYEESRQSVRSEEGNTWSQPNKDIQL